MIMVVLVMASDGHVGGDYGGSNNGNTYPITLAEAIKHQI